MLFEELPSELLLEIFSYLHSSDLFGCLSPSLHPRLAHLISQSQISLDLTRASVSRVSLVSAHCSPAQIVFLRLTNQYSHGLLIAEFFASDHLRPAKFDRLRSLHLDDVTGSEIDTLPPVLEKLYVKFHKKAAHAIRLYQIALRSSSLKQCYLIGGYAFDRKTCGHVSSTSIEHLHMAVKSFPDDLFAVLQALPSLKKLKSATVLLYEIERHSFSSSSHLHAIVRYPIHIVVHVLIGPSEYRPSGHWHYSQGIGFSTALLSITTAIVDLLRIGKVDRRCRPSHTAIQTATSNSIHPERSLHQCRCTLQRFQAWPRHGYPEDHS